MKIKIVTGMSGAGKSTVVNSLEDMGYYCIDNLPPNLMKEFIMLYESGVQEYDKVAFVMDLRMGRFFQEVEGAITSLKEKGYDIDLIFVDATDDVLLKRFKETRRVHPMSQKDTVEGIRIERERLLPLKNQADYYIDSSKLNIHQLKDRIKKFFADEGGNQFTVVFKSFGFKWGILNDADLVFDLRFLPNPHYIEALRPLTGKDQAVRDYVMSFEESKTFYQMLLDMLVFLLPKYQREGKSSLVIGMGCTGGQHRSVTFALLLSWALQEAGYQVEVQHREHK